MGIPFFTYAIWRIFVLLFSFNHHLRTETSLFLFRSFNRPGDIESVCDTLLDPAYPTETDLDAYVRWYTSEIFGSNPADGDCIDGLYESDVEYYRNTSWESYATRSAGRQWFYQTCAEYGWYQTSGSRFQPFGSSFPVDLYIRWCRDVYGEMLSNICICAWVDVTISLM